MLHTRVPAVLLVISMNGVNNAVALILHWYPSSQTSARLPPLRVQASTRDALAWMNRLPKKLSLTVLAVGRGQIQVSRSHRTRIFFSVSCINHLNVQHECQLTSGSPGKFKAGEITWNCQIHPHGTLYFSSELVGLYPSCRFPCSHPSLRKDTDMWTTSLCTDDNCFSRENIPCASAGRTGRSP